MKIDEFILDSGWSKSEIAQKLGISKAAVSKWDEIPVLQLETLRILLGRTEKPDFVETAEAMENLFNPDDLFLKANIPDLVAEGKLEDHDPNEVSTSEISVDGLIRSIDQTPVELRKIVKREWKLKGEKVYWQQKWWGHGSDYDFQYSASQLRRWGKALKQSTNQELFNRTQFRRDNVSGNVPGIDCTPDQNTAQMLAIFSDVRSNTICPIVVDEIENRWVNGKPMSLRVNPWERVS